MYYYFMRFRWLFKFTENQISNENRPKESAFKFSNIDIDLIHVYQLLNDVNITTTMAPTAIAVNKEDKEQISKVISIGNEWSHEYKKEMYQS